jgi:hypothetical protein
MRGTRTAVRAASALFQIRQASFTKLTRRGAHTLGRRFLRGGRPAASARYSLVVVSMQHA